ncbi:hypothetical protein ACOSQ2_026082 [Xanthoceras sorbifolium]
MDLDCALGLDGCVSLGTCTLHWHILNWDMLVDRDCCHARCFSNRTAVIYGLEPLWGAGFAWFLLGERWGTGGWIGAALVLGGSLWVQICRSTSPNKSIEAEDCNPERNLIMVPDLDKQKLGNNLPASPVVVRTKKNVTDILK